jgi:hypothetical protein
MWDLSNDTKKHTTKSRETIPLSWKNHKWSKFKYENIKFKKELDSGLASEYCDLRPWTIQ